LWQKDQFVDLDCVSFVFNSAVTAGFTRVHHRK
jgi:hypothetical protein